MKQLRRTVLFVPANNPRMVEKASKLNSDMVILDCEDSVPESEKGRARETLSNSLSSHSWAGKEVGIRINGLDTPHYEEDLKRAVAAGPRFIAIPKVETADEVRAVDRTIRRLAGDGYKEDSLPKIMVIVETPRGLIAVEQILSSSPLVTAVEFGSEDFSLSMGIYGFNRSELATIYARSRVVAAAHAFHVDPLDEAFVDLRDVEGLRASAANARSLGFVGKGVIHPSQIDVVNQVFSPSKEEIAWARRVLDAWAEARKEGKGAFRLDEKMVDIVHVKMAERILGEAEMTGSR